MPNETTLYAPTGSAPRERRSTHRATGGACISGRCVDCGQRAALVTICEGFDSLGWCASCSREAMQGKLELRGGSR